MRVPIAEWKAPTSTCPQCFNAIEVWAVPYGSGWYLEERCFCKHINEQMKWPFTEDSGELAAMDLHRAGIEVDELSTDVEITIEDEEQYEQELEDYMDEVDHGWEDSYGF